MKKTNLLLLVAFLFTYYLIIWTVFIKYDPKKATPRLGTTLWHSSSDNGDKELIYCYYPQGSVSFSDKPAEYALKKAGSIEECDGWMGTAIFREVTGLGEHKKELPST